MLPRLGRRAVGAGHDKDRGRAFRPTEPAHVERRPAVAANHSATHARRHAEPGTGRRPAAIHPSIEPAGQGVSFLLECAGG